MHFLNIKMEEELIMMQLQLIQYGIDNKHICDYTVGTRTSSSFFLLRFPRENYAASAIDLSSAAELVVNVMS